MYSVNSWKLQNTPTIIQHLAVSLMQWPGQRSGREQGAMNGERRERERDKRGGIFYYVTSEMDYSR